MSKRSISPFERYGTPTPIEDAAIRLHAFTATDTLSNLAEKYYDDCRQWRLIADRNKIVDPRQMAIGTILIIPKLPLQKGRF